MNTVFLQQHASKQEPWNSEFPSQENIQIWCKFGPLKCRKEGLQTRQSKPSY